MLRLEQAGAGGREQLRELLLLDLHMPYFSGWDFVESFAALPAAA